MANSDTLADSSDAPQGPQVSLLTGLWSPLIQATGNRRHLADTVLPRTLALAMFTADHQVGGYV